MIELRCPCCDTTSNPVKIAEEAVRRYRRRDTGEDADRYCAALDEWMRRGEEIADVD